MDKTGKPSRVSYYTDNYIQCDGSQALEIDVRKQEQGRTPVRTKLKRLETKIRENNKEGSTKIDNVKPMKRGRNKVFEFQTLINEFWTTINEFWIIINEFWTKINGFWTKINGWLILRKLS